MVNRVRQRHLKRWGWTVGAVGLMGVLATSAKANEPGRSMWMWSQHGFPALDDPLLGRASLDFLKSKNITTIYLYADLDSFHGRNVLVSEPQKYKTFITAAHKRDMQVYALFGDNGRQTEGLILPERRDEAVTLFQNMLDYNATANPNERFDGANVDVEPYLLPDWETNTTLRAQQYLDLSAVYMSMKRDYLAQIGETDPSKFPVGPATPFWFETIPNVTWADPTDPTAVAQTKPLYQHVLDIHDYVTILDYRDFALVRDERGDGIFPGRTDSIVFLPQEELEYAEDLGKPVVIGVETSPQLPIYVSFAEDGPERFEQELALALAEFQSDWPDTFSGFAIHDFTWYQRLLNDGPIITGPPFPEPSGGVLWLGTVALGWIGGNRRRVR